MAKCKSVDLGLRPRAPSQAHVPRPHAVCEEHAEFAAADDLSAAGLGDPRKSFTFVWRGLRLKRASSLQSYYSAIARMSSTASIMSKRSNNLSRMSLTLAGGAEYLAAIICTARRAVSGDTEPCLQRK
jgi:hypothetical protein